MYRYCLPTDCTYRLNVQMCGQTAVGRESLDGVQILVVSQVEVWEGQNHRDVDVVNCKMTNTSSTSLGSIQLCYN